MAGLGYVKEVLRIAAPELIFATVIVYSLGASSILVPLRLELLFNGTRQLDQVDLL